MRLEFRVSMALAAGVAALAAAATAGAQTVPPVPTPVPTAPQPGLIAPGVTVDGVDVSGLSRRDAEIRVATAVVAPKRRTLVLVVRGRRVPVNPVAAGYSASVSRAVKAAYNVGRSQPVGPVDIPLTEGVDRAKLRRVVVWRSRGRNVPAQNARTTLTGGRLVMSRARDGVEVDVDRSVELLSRRMLSRTAATVTLPTRRVRAAVTVPPTAVLIQRDAFRLTVAHKGRIRTFGVAVGQPAYPTPRGDFSIVNMQRNPTWYPPDSRWAAGLGPVPPGAGNPLGTRWMGISAPGIGMHGTPSPGSIGTRASHGCIRLRIPDAEALYALVSVGDPVYIR